jgi:hypothetical protein
VSNSSTDTDVQFILVLVSARALPTLAKGGEKRGTCQSWRARINYEGNFQEIRHVGLIHSTSRFRRCSRHPL